MTRQKSEAMIARMNDTQPQKSRLSDYLDLTGGKVKLNLTDEAGIDRFLRSKITPSEASDDIRGLLAQIWAQADPKIHSVLFWMGLGASAKMRLAQSGLKNDAGIQILQETLRNILTPKADAGEALIAAKARLAAMGVDDKSTEWLLGKINELSHMLRLTDYEAELADLRDRVQTSWDD